MLKGTRECKQLDREMPEVFLLTTLAVRFGEIHITNFLLEVIRIVKYTHADDQGIPDPSIIDNII